MYFTDLTLRQTNEACYHIVDGDKSSSMLTRYGILHGEDGPLTGNAVTLTENGATLRAKREIALSFIKLEKGYTVTIPMSEGERIFGLGDANRENVMIRGMKILLNKANVRCYGPMPILLSSDGWALLINTTYRSHFDIGSQGNDIEIRVAGGQLDMYLFHGDTLIDLTRRVTEITGRPMILPKFAYGFTVVNNENIGVVNLLDYTRLYRENDIPCDCMGLEPYWMEKFYDFSTEKDWNKEKFCIPYWHPKNGSGATSFFHPLRRMGMQLSLWLCEDYDLLYHEEQSVLCAVGEDGYSEDDEIFDVHFANAAIYQDKITKQGERWFKHLERFVDNGASAFKLDGSNQVLEHPDRLWGGKFTDDEVHNVYPVLLAKEMNKGFYEYTGRRIMTNTACAYIGTQQYAATWAGDTGGGPKTLVSVMNYAMCGHSNSGCDIDVTDLASMHYGFLMPWTQQNNWAAWNYPWYLGEELAERIRFYSKFRSSIFPYLYYAAYTAYKEGIPMLRPLPLVYDGTDRYDGVKNAYMLGDSLYVGAFDMRLPLPEGKWIDYFTGDVYEGGGILEYERPQGIGGALLVKEGALIVTMTPQQYILEREHEYIVNLYPSQKPGHTAIYEDDGFTYDYESGGYALTEISSDGIKDGSLRLTVHARTGSFAGREDNGSNIRNNSIPKIGGMSELTDLRVLVHGTPTAVYLDGTAVELTVNEQGSEFTVPAALRTGDLTYTVNFN